MGKLGMNSKYWCYLFFLYWKNTAIGYNNRVNSVNSAFSSYVSYFENPNKIDELGESAIKNIIDLYIQELNRVLMGAPIVMEAFNTYKVSSMYPGLPQTIQELPTSVEQAPFNSTSIDPQFNFSAFLPKDPYGNPQTMNAAFFKIKLPVGARGCLYVPAYIHAYSFEAEIILPTGCKFDITYMSKGNTLNYVDPKTINMDVEQEQKNIMMGEVYNPNKYFPCYPGGCRKKTLTNLTIYDATYSGP
jgi:hypothetical protein